MKELEFWVFVAVFEEMLGPWLWVAMAASALALAAFIAVLLRDRGIRPRRLVWAQAAAVLGGGAAVLVMQAVTHSGFRDIGGPIDWVLGMMIFAAGALGSLVAAYALLGLLPGRRVGRDAEASGSPGRARWQAAATILAAAALSAQFQAATLLPF